MGARILLKTATKPLFEVKISGKLGFQAAFLMQKRRSTIKTIE